MKKISIVLCFMLVCVIILTTIGIMTYSAEYPRSTLLPKGGTPAYANMSGIPNKQDVGISDFTVGVLDSMVTPLENGSAYKVDDVSCIIVSDISEDTTLTDVVDNYLLSLYPKTDETVTGSIFDTGYINGYEANYYTGGTGILINKMYFVTYSLTLPDKSNIFIGCFTSNMHNLSLLKELCDNTISTIYSESYFDQLKEQLQEEERKVSLTVSNNAKEKVNNEEVQNNDKDNTTNLIYMDTDEYAGLDTFEDLMAAARNPGIYYTDEYNLQVIADSDYDLYRLTFSWIDVTVEPSILELISPDENTIYEPIESLPGEVAFVIPAVSKGDTFSLHIKSENVSGYCFIQEDAVAYENSVDTILNGSPYHYEEEDVTESGLHTEDEIEDK